MLIQWLGHSSFLIVSDEGTKIVTDPYEPGCYDGTFRYAPIDIWPDIVTVSHNHADHCGLSQFTNDFHVVAKPGVTTIKGITITGISSYHNADMSIPNIIFMMNVDRVRICHLGDLGYELSPDEIERIGAVDILLIPVGGHYTIDAREATELVNRIRPKVVMPMHYLTERLDFSITPVDDFLRGKENVRRLDTSEYEIIKEQLPDQTAIVVLKHAR